MEIVYCKGRIIMLEVYKKKMPVATYKHVKQFILGKYFIQSTEKKPSCMKRDMQLYVYKKKKKTTRRRQNMLAYSHSFNFSFCFNIQ